jgi:dTDP-4-amino-4,6-dideoxygalactose transaminase
VYRIAGADLRAEILAVPDMGHGTAIGPAIDFLRRALTQTAPPAVPADAVPVPPIRITFDAPARRRFAETIDAVLDSGVLTLGATVAAFERALEPWVGGPAVAVDSGSAALEIPLRRLAVAGRVVLVPVNTFFATAAGALRAGAEVDFVDLEPHGLGLDPEALTASLDRHGDRVAAVIAVHIGGIVAPSLRRVLHLCHARGIPVVEDAAHAFGSLLDGQPAGSLADIGAFSFYPTKVLTTGEGGALTARDPEALEAFRSLRDHGRSAPGATTHGRLGSNWRLSELHAALGLAHLGDFARQAQARARIAARYDRGLADLPGLRIHAVPEGSTTNWYKYIAELPPEVDRSSLKARLRADHGVRLAGEVYDLLLVEQPFFAGHPHRGVYPHAERFAARHVCLPIFPDLTAGEQDRIIASLRKELS